MRPSVHRIKVTAADWIARRDAGLSPSESAELERWLDADPSHREAFSRCDSTWNAMDRPFLAGSAEELLVRVNTCVRHDRRQRFGAAAIALTVVACTAVIWRMTWPAAVVQEPDGTGTAIVVHPARQILSDHTVVELNANAVIAVDFHAQVRRVVLEKGEAHFQVAKDSTRPFVVRVGNIEVRALGTGFVIQRGHSSVDVLVTEGQVAVDNVQPSIDAGRAGKGSVSAAALPGPLLPPPAPVVLKAGYRAVVDFSAATLAQARVDILPPSDASERLAWRAPQLEFGGTPLSEAIALLNAEADKAAAAGRPAPRYIIGDPEIAAIRVSGLFRVDNTDSFVRLLEHGFGIEAEQDEGRSVTVLRKAR